MAHIGVICPPATGHLNPMCALGRELQRRGHGITFFGVPDAQSKVIQSGLDYRIIGEAEFPNGKMEEIYKQLGKMNGVAGVNFTINLIQKGTAMLFREAPEALRAARVEAILADQISPAGGTIADYLNLPFITICNAVLLHEEPMVPPIFTHWSYHKAWWAALRNRVGYFFGNCIKKSIHKLIMRQRRQWKLPPCSRREDVNSSKLAQICQLPKEFDFPRVNLPECFHYTGPLHDPNRLAGLKGASLPSVSFPFEKLTKQPLIYASLGTLQNREWKIFHCIAEACVGLDVQLVISLGDPHSKESGKNLPGSPLVVPYAPQLQIIEKADLIITHSGLNTVLEALSRGVPIVAIPITNDQPGTAARLARIGVGEVIPSTRISARRLRSAIQRVLRDDSYKKNASRLQGAIRRAGGVLRAADIIEQAISKKKPVLSSAKGSPSKIMQV